MVTTVSEPAANTSFHYVSFGLNIPAKTLLYPRASRGRAERADSSRGVRLRTGVVFHKAALKVSWQAPAARLCKETTETSGIVQRRRLCCPDFLRNLNELFVKNH